MDQLPWLGKRELICLLLFTCNYVVSVWRGFLFLWVLGVGYIILLWHSLNLPYNYFRVCNLSSFYDWPNFYCHTLSNCYTRCSGRKHGCILITQQTLPLNHYLRPLVFFLAWLLGIRTRKEMICSVRTNQKRLEPKDLKPYM